MPALLSPRRLRASDIRVVGLSLRRLSETLAKPCTCGRDDCTIGEHVWRATRDGQPGPRAQNLDPNRAHGVTDTTPDLDRRPRLADGQHSELNELAARLYADSVALDLLFAHWSPDRRDEPLTSDADWCRHHLDTIGVCEPRYRGDLCRRCYDVVRSEGYRPPEPILLAWHRGERVTAKMIQNHRPAKKRRRRRAA